MKRITALATVCCLLGASFTATAEEAPSISVKKAGDLHQVFIGDELFVGYNTKNTAKPFLYPIIGPTGANMTRHYPMKKGVAGESDDHPHHTSLWFAHGGVNGVDLWHGKGKVVENVLSVTPDEPKPKTGIIASDIWLKKDRSAMADVVTVYQFEVLGDGSRVIDYITSIKPGEGVDQLVFADTKEGTMAIRLAPQLRLKGAVATGKAVNSEGHKDKAVWGKRAKWVAYWGQIDGKTCGVAIFDHPENLRHPTWWHARDYGLVAANPFGMSDFERGKHKRGAGSHTVAKDDTLNFSYRFVFFAGTPGQVDIARKYEKWVQSLSKKN